MKLLYDPETGKIIHAFLERDAVLFSHTTNIPLAELEIDEIEANATLCRELLAQISWRDANGLRRWFVQDGQLFERDNWIPEIL